MNGSSSRIEDCYIAYNTATDGDGAGVFSYNSTVTLTGCTILGNVAGDSWMNSIGLGGGICGSGSDLRLLDCMVSENWSLGGSGGVQVHSGSTLELVNCVISNNEAYSWMIMMPFFPAQGGGVGCSGAPCTIEGCLFVGNYSEEPGAALCNGDFSVSSCTFVGNYCEDDQAGSVIGKALYGAYSVDFENCLMAYNAGQAIDCLGDVIISCCDIYGNGSDWVECLEDQLGLNGNFRHNPVFCDTSAGNYTVAEGSPCLPGYNSCDAVVGAYGTGCETVCGDADRSGQVDIDDLVYLVCYVLAGGPEPLPVSSGDSDCTGGESPIDIDDAVYLMEYVFMGGYSPCDIDGDGVPNCLDDRL
jgi:hypothetical protein